MWSSSQQINTAPQLMASIMTIIIRTSLRLPHTICETHKKFLIVRWDRCLQWEHCRTLRHKLDDSSLLGRMSCSKIQWLLCNQHLAQTTQTFLSSQNSYSLVTNVISSLRIFSPEVIWWNLHICRCLTSPSFKWTVLVYSQRVPNSNWK